MHFLCRDSADSPKCLNGQTGNKIECLRGMNHAKSVGLAVVGGYLRQKFVVRHSCRRCQIEFLTDAALYVFGNVDSQLNVLLVFCHIKKCLVDRQWLYDVCIIMENRVDMLGNLFIHTHPYRCEYQLRTVAKSNDR